MMTRILGIAPYAGLKNMMERMAQLDDEISLVCHIGDFKDGLELLSNVQFSNFDVIVSRGGTADLLREYSPIPVLSIGLSYYDILNATTLAQSFEKPLALVGFPSTVRFASMLYDILKYDIPIYTANSDDEVEHTLLELMKQNVSVVIGDNMITRHAQALGMQAILIASGSESVAEAFRQASMFSRYHQQIRRENAYYQEAFALTSRRILILDQAGRIVFSTLSSSQKSCHTAARKLLPAVSQYGKQQVIRRISKKNLLITADQFIYEKKLLTACEFISLDEYFPNRFSSVSLIEQSEIDVSILHYFYDMTPGSHFDKMAADCRKMRTVILYGEEGTCKDEIAGYLYRTGSYASSVMFTVNCEVLQEKEFHALFHSNDSPLFYKGHTFYFRHFHRLPSEMRKNALKIMRDGDIAIGNQLLFSVCPNTCEDNSLYPCSKEISVFLPSIMQQLVPLRNRIHEIPAFITLYLKELAVQSSYQIAGIEPEAVNYLQSFYWDGNFRQFVRVLDTLAQLTTTSYIRTEDVLKILETEKLLIKKAEAASTAVNINQPLNDIISDIIHMVLDQKGMTKTKAASQLGICRATLWKYLK